MENQQQQCFIPEHLGSIFQPILISDLHEVELADLLFESQLQCGFQIDNGIPGVLALTQQFIDFRQSSDLIWRCRFDFQLKMGIIHHDQTNPKSKIIGFKLSKNPDLPPLVFCSNDPLMPERWVNLLSQKIKIEGFHFYFKGMRHLGKGNSARVYKIKHHRDGIEYAVKAFPKKSFEKKPQLLPLLINQINTLRKIHHTNIIQLKAVYESENTIYVVTELLSGATLKDRIGEISVESARKIIFCLLLALNYLKDNEICHRDLKLENIMLRNIPDMIPVIIDFGMSIHYPTQKHPKIDSLCGTAGYVAPEAFINEMKNSSISEKRDIFSIGVIFHILLLRKMVFDGDVQELVLQKNKECQIDFSEPKYSYLKPEMLSLLKKMLEADPSKRISCQEALNDPYFNGLDKLQFQAGPDTFIHAHNS